MPKVKKKRTKKYAGSNTAQRQPSIRRISAVQRSHLVQWLHDRRQLLKTVGGVIGVTLVIALIIAGIGSIVAGR